MKNLLRGSITLSNKMSPLLVILQPACAPWSVWFSRQSLMKCSSLPHLETTMSWGCEQFNLLYQVSEEPSQGFHYLIQQNVTTVGDLATCMCTMVSLVQQAVLNEMFFTATLETTIVPDGIYGTVGLVSWPWGSSSSKVQCSNLLFLVLLNGMTKNFLQVFDLI